MRRALLLSLALAAVGLAGCPSKPKDGECKTSEDCKDQQGFGKVCVSGRCEECAQDVDCKAGFVCRQNRCTPRPECERPDDCPGGKSCEAGRCVTAAPKAECTSDAQCGSDQACEAGRCVARAAPAARCQLEPVSFDFDRADIRPDARAILEKDLECLKTLGAKKLRIEGHCDERGTTEYNMHLGQRRAESVRKYLGNLGFDRAGMQAVSYGKERPICTESTEDCWARNRRGDLRAE